MSTVSKYTPGQFCWVDLMPRDAEAARAFYTELFGWGVIDSPTDQGGVYTQFTCGEHLVAGMGEMSEEMKASGMPAVWSSYVSVEDVEASTRRAAELGAEVAMPPMQIMSVGRMSIIQDPVGARLSLWQAQDHIGAGLVNEPVSFAWNELTTRDPHKAMQFYKELFGWEYSASPSETGQSEPYREIRNAGRGNGGILELDGNMGDMPDVWTCYFSVEDCDASVARLQELGGQVYMPPTDIAPGRFAVVADPQGAVFNLMKLNEPE